MIREILAHLRWCRTRPATSHPDERRRPASLIAKHVMGTAADQAAADQRRRRRAA